MTTGQAETQHFELGLHDVQLGFKVKSPKLTLGSLLELGLAASYSFTDVDDDSTRKKAPLVSLDRLKPTIIVKDCLLRGKLELEPHERKLHYSKKLRLPYVNTDLLKLRFTAALPSAETAGGLLGRGLGFTLTFAPPERLHRSTLVRDAPNYSMQLAPRLGPPQLVYDKLGFPGSVFLKAHATAHITDAPTASGLRARLDVHRVNAVVRLYDPARVKPSRAGRNLVHVARRLVLEDLEVTEEERTARAASAADAEAPEPDIIDRAAAKAREWSHAVLVNSCVATRHLQEQAAEAGELLKGMLGGPRPKA
ncbi:hypothetical protein GPECTOR_2g1161 [Gonium pectorale]|uniref:Uncharacterized protein n=1 Tax=Gonium pectorale TaxID=33097 RepID=A0A150H0J8_GONPE|nr:hypothetical protein GPECTOR_2g1161 [Gonium pectorale]|eukprot:KXZ55611.1 hypothetical protein GPECTOR_2g1161 [Gonium pectorale]